MTSTHNTPSPRVVEFFEILPVPAESAELASPPAGGVQLFSTHWRGSRDSQTPFPSTLSPLLLSVMVEVSTPVVLTVPVHVSPPIT